ncbi:hypothetical protein P9112_014109 [Eukaryota sp. TZLM1-RC]
MDPPTSPKSPRQCSPLHRQIFRDLPSLNSTSEVDNSPKQYEDDPDSWLCESPPQSPNTSSFSTDHVSPPLRLEFTPRQTSLTTPSFKKLQEKFAAGNLDRAYPDHQFSLPDLPLSNASSESELHSPRTSSPPVPIPESPSIMDKSNAIDDYLLAVDTSRVTEQTASHEVAGDDVIYDVIEESFDEDDYKHEEVNEGENSIEKQREEKPHEEIPEEHGEQGDNIPEQSNNQFDLIEELIVDDDTHEQSVVLDQHSIEENFQKNLSPNQTTISIANEVDFGTVPLRSSMGKVLPLRNTLNSEAQLKLLIEPFSQAFSLSPNQMTLPPTSSASVLVSFYPEREGDYETDLKVMVNGSVVLLFTLKGNCTSIKSPIMTSSPSVSGYIDSVSPLFSCPSNISLKKLPLKTSNYLDNVYFQIPLKSLVSATTNLQIKLFPTDETGALITNSNDPRFDLLSLLSGNELTLPPKAPLSLRIGVNPVVVGEFSAIVVIKAVSGEANSSFSEAINISGNVFESRVELSHASLEYGILPLIMSSAQKDGQNDDVMKRAAVKTIEVQNRSSVKSRFLLSIKTSSSMETEGAFDPITSSPFLIKLSDCPGQPQSSLHVTMDPGQTLKLLVYGFPQCTILNSNSEFINFRNSLATHPKRLVATLNVVSVVDFSIDSKPSVFELFLTSCVLSMRVGVSKIQVHRETRSRTKFQMTRHCEVSESDVIIGSCHSSTTLQLRNGGHVTDELTFEVEPFDENLDLSELVANLDVVLESNSLLLEPGKSYSLGLTATLPIETLSHQDLKKFKKFFNADPLEFSLSLSTYSNNFFLFSIPISCFITLKPPSLPLDLVCDKPVLSFGVCGVSKQTKEVLTIRNNSIPSNESINDLFGLSSSSKVINVSIPKLEEADDCFKLLLNGQEVSEGSFELSRFSFELTVLFKPKQAISYRSLLVLIPATESVNPDYNSEYRIPLLGNGGSSLLQIPNIDVIRIPSAITLRNSGTRAAALKVLSIDNHITAEPSMMLVEPKNTVSVRLSTDLSVISSSKISNILLASVDYQILSYRKLATSNSLPMAETDPDSLIPSENLVKLFGRSTAVRVVEELNCESSWESPNFDLSLLNFVEQGSGSKAEPGDRLYDFFYISKNFKQSLSITSLEVTLEGRPKHEKVLESPPERSKISRHETLVIDPDVIEFDDKTQSLSVLNSSNQSLVLTCTFPSFLSCSPRPPLNLAPDQKVLFELTLISKPNLESCSLVFKSQAISTGFSHEQRVLAKFSPPEHFFNHYDDSPPSPRSSLSRSPITEHSIKVLGVPKLFVKSDFISCVPLVLWSVAKSPIKFAIKSKLKTEDHRQIRFDSRSGELGVDPKVVSVSSAYLSSARIFAYDLFYDKCRSPIPLNIEVVDPHSKFSKPNLSGSRNSLHFREELNFGEVLAGHTSKLKLRVCNGSGGNLHVFSPLVDSPFRIKHDSIFIKSKSFVLVPVSFTPPKIGYFSLFLGMVSEEGDYAFVNIVGKGIESTKSVEIIKSNGDPNHSFSLRNNSRNPISFRVLDLSFDISPSSGYLREFSEVELCTKKTITHSKLEIEVRDGAESYILRYN